MADCRLVAYYRVSTARQGQSGLGLESQRTDVERHAVSTGCEIIASFTEVETGKRSDRPVLARAIACARRMKATLIIAKLDRLARNVKFISTLMESKVPFVCCDNPTATPLTIHIIAAVAEDEARAISARTKAALSVYKAAGVPLGAARPESRNLTLKARQRGAVAAGRAVARNAREAYRDVEPDIKRWLAEGLSQRQIAANLNADGHTTRTGKPIGQVQVLRIIRRMAVG